MTHHYPRYSPGEVTSPLELVQSLLCGRLAPGSHVIITSRPHTLTYLQVLYVTLSLCRREEADNYLLFASIEIGDT